MQKNVQDRNELIFLPKSTMKRFTNLWFWEADQLIQVQFHAKPLVFGHYLATETLLFSHLSATSNLSSQ